MVKRENLDLEKQPGDSLSAASGDHERVDQIQWQSIQYLHVLQWWTNGAVPGGQLVTMNPNLTWGRLFSRLRAMAPEPHPTSKHVCGASTPAPVPGLMSTSVSTSSTNSCTKRTQRKRCSGHVRRTDGIWLCAVGTHGSISPTTNLGFRPRYENGGSHLQRQISEVPFLDHILHGHSSSNMHTCENSQWTKSPFEYSSVWRCKQKLHTWIGVWSRGATSALFFLDLETLIACPARDCLSEYVIREKQGMLLNVNWNIWASKKKNG